MVGFKNLPVNNVYSYDKFTWRRNMSNERVETLVFELMVDQLSANLELA